MSQKKVDASAAAKYGELEFVSVPAIAKPPTLSPRMVPFLWKFWRTTRQARRLLKERKADIVIGMGGFTSLPPLWAGKKLGLVTALHDSNALPGKSNRLGARWCTKVLIALEAARSYFPGSEVEVVGTPVRSEFDQLPSPVEARARFGLTEGKPVVLCFGGSQGARNLNSLVAEASAELGEEVQWIHVAGAADEDRVRDLASGRPNHVVLGFCSEMPSAYAASDLVISRSGGASLTELSYLGLPAFLVPFPYAADDHQTHNAKAFVDEGAAELAQESDLDGAGLGAQLNQLLQDVEKLEAMSKAMRALSVDDSAARICNVLAQQA